MIKLISKFLPKAIKDSVKRRLKKKQFNTFKKEAQILTKDKLILELKKSGIELGDALFIHSSLKGLGYIENGPNTLIDALKTAVGPEGTLVFPTFTLNSSMFETLKDPTYYFDLNNSKSTVGAITNAFLSIPGVERSLHPTHSVAAWGKNAELICSNHHLAETNFGEGTPFGKFLNLNGKLVGLGINYAHVTFYHVFEDLNLGLFPEVYLERKLKAKLVDKDGNIVAKETLCHNPPFHRTRIEKDPEVEQYFRNHFEQNAISKTTEIGQGAIWWMHTQDLISELAELNKKGITIYNTKEQ